MKLPISVIILTFNEEKNIEDCIKSVKDFVEYIYIVDSYSTDKTLDIVRKYTSNILQHPFENYSLQRNWALENLPVETEWIFNLDADHRVTIELWKELEKVFNEGINDNIKGFMVSRRIIFMEKWIKHGGIYPTYHAVIFRKGFGRCEDRFYDQHFIINGKALLLKNDIIDILTDSLKRFTERHNKWAISESIEQLTSKNGSNQLKPNLSGNKMERRRYFRKTYDSFPLFYRSFVYFLYRYVIRLGFLDGPEGLIFHILQGFWYKFLIDSTIFEMNKKAKKEKKDIQTIINEYYS